MLTELVIENVKAFGPRQVVPLAPITLILGPNSAGKSTLIQSINLLRQSLSQSDFGSELRLRGNLVDLGSFEGFVHRHKVDQSVVIGLTVKDSLLPFGVLGLIFTFNQDSDRTIVLDNVEFQSECDWDFGVSKSVLRRTLEVPTSKLINFFKSLDGNYSDRDVTTRVGDSEIEAVVQGPTTELTTILENYLKTPEGLRAKIFLRSRFPFAITGIGDHPSILATIGDEEYDFEIDLNFSKTLQKILDHYQGIWLGALNTWRGAVRKTTYLGPFRQLPERISIGTSERLRYTGLNGENVVNYLAQRPHLIPKVNVWFANLNIPYSIKVLPVQIIGLHHSQEDMNGLILTDEKSGVQVSMQDVGYGISQILPIIVESITSQNSTLLIEQPELHLHPAIQSKLGDLFVEQCQTRQFIIETHSEHLVLRMKRLIRRGVLNAKDVALLSVNSNPDGTSSVTRIRLDSDGEFIDEWPRGFFDERLDEIFGD
jgi:ABC-type lipoprotein export system ATPase subunit